MGSIQNLTGALWRKSSYSGSNGGDCVECAPLGLAAWRKASYSAAGDCIEIAAQPCLVAVRDSKNPDGPVFTVAPEAFATFVRSV
ncbi:DUF397 domain-containing protein [Streptomyces sp. NBC_01310]|uniref:DUF397 domain-containing protein n=1 Tax=Streptomyces sp. NBC_01310 TaxID=2903820 RepID=UPI0035B58943|nr:DUF397 domain-containing protein [Streptomyces sp. NBC_01310]